MNTSFISNLHEIRSVWSIFLSLLECPVHGNKKRMWLMERSHGFFIEEERCGNQLDIADPKQNNCGTGVSGLAACDRNTKYIHVGMLTWSAGEDCNVKLSPTPFLLNKKNMGSRMSHIPKKQCPKNDLAAKSYVLPRYSHPRYSHRYQSHRYPHLH